MIRQHLTIMVKGDISGLLSLTTDGNIGVIGKQDNRDTNAIVKPFETQAEATTVYKQAVSDSIKNEWTIVYSGEPNFG